MIRFKIFCITITGILFFTHNFAMYQSPAQRLFGRKTRFFKGDPIGTAQALVDNLTHAMPTIKVEKIPDTYTNDGLVIEVCGERPYQFITPGGTYRVTQVPHEPTGLTSYFLPSGILKKIELFYPEYNLGKPIRLTTWLSYWIDILSNYEIAQITPISRQTGHAYFIIKRDLNGEPLHEHPMIPGRLYT